MDRLERLKGIPLKLMAIDQFMEENPQWLGKIVFTLVGITAGERGQDYRQTLHDVKIIVKELNLKYLSSQHKEQLVYFEERSDKDSRLAQRLPFFAAADILMITATRYSLSLACLFALLGNSISQCRAISGASSFEVAALQIYLCSVNFETFSPTNRTECLVS